MIDPTLRLIIAATLAPIAYGLYIYGVRTSRRPIAILAGISATGFLSIVVMQGLMLL